MKYHLYNRYTGKIYFITRFWFVARLVHRYTPFCVTFDRYADD